MYAVASGHLNKGIKCLKVHFKAPVCDHGNCSLIGGSGGGGLKHSCISPKMMIYHQSDLS